MSLIDELQAIYDALPTVACQRKCAESCSVAPYVSIEAERMQAYAGRKTRIGHDPKVLRALERATTVEELIELMPVCPLLRNGGCTIHVVRPFSCRAFGISDALPCPHGCEVTPRPLTVAETDALKEAVADLGDRWNRGER